MELETEADGKLEAKVQTETIMEMEREVKTQTEGESVERDPESDTRTGEVKRERETEPVRVCLSGSAPLLWRSADLRLVRERMGIVGTLVGSLARQPRQNCRLGRPLQLLLEEARLLKDTGRAVLAKGAESVTLFLLLLDSTSFLFLPILFSLFTVLAIDDDDGDILGPSPGSKEEEDLLDDQDEGKDSKHWAPQRKDNLAPSEAPGTKQEETAPPASAPTRPAAVLRKREELSFDEDGDELMEALGFGESPKGRRRAEDATPQPARSRLDEILGRGTAPRLLERPLTGESKEVQQEKRSHRNQTDAVVGEEDFTFGAYQPTVASTPEGRQSRRQSVRFSTEDISGLSPEKKLKPATPATPLSARSSKPAADWLGLKEEEAADWRSPSPVRDSLRPPPSPDVPAPQIPSPSNKPPGSSRPPSGSKVTDTPLPASGRTPHSGPRLEASVSTEEDDWLAGALSRKRQQEKGVGSWDLDETDAPVSKPVSSPASRRRPSLTEPPNNTG
ncbi:UNVERIFIED_CONTAM: hypothetical protein FKN15_074228 [Acipenser sinensis]